jgi:hypothetical protein
MKKIYLLLILLLLPSNIFAFDIPFPEGKNVYVSYSFLTEHLNGGKDLNENNDVIALEIDNYFITTFNNSHYKRSVAFGYSFKTNKVNFYKGYTRLILRVGPLYGYKSYMPTTCGWALGIAPMFEIGYKNFAIETLYIPVDSGVMVCMFKVKFQ